MSLSNEHKDYLLKKIEDLPPEKVEEVIDFVDFLKLKSEPHPSHSSRRVSHLLLEQRALAKLWENDEDLYEL